jgi:hypothetical protein
VLRAAVVSLRRVRACGVNQVGVFGLYLLMCAAKGNFKFGARFLLISVRARLTACPSLPLLRHPFRGCAAPGGLCARCCGVCPRAALLHLRATLCSVFPCMNV